MKIVVFGSTGGTGRELVEQALHQGHHVTAQTRPVLRRHSATERSGCVTRL